MENELHEIVFQRSHGNGFLNVPDPNENPPQMAQIVQVALLEGGRGGEKGKNPLTLDNPQKTI